MMTLPNHNNNNNHHVPHFLDAYRTCDSHGRERKLKLIITDKKNEKGKRE